VKASTLKTTLRPALARLALLLAPVLTVGCKQELLCKPLGDCGGPAPISRLDSATIAQRQQEWVLIPGHPSCTEDLYVPANDTRLGQAPPVAGGTPYPEPALFDWCILLVTGPNPGPSDHGIQLKPPRFYYESGPIGATSIKYDETGHFSAGITRTGTFTLDFPEFCVRAFGALDNRPPDPEADPTDPHSQPADVCKQLEVPVRASGLGEGSYRNTTCEREDPGAPPGTGGCICRFDVTETGGPSGFYGIDGNTIVHIPGTNFPLRATYCAGDDTLQLTGADDTYLFDQRGVRTFDLVRSCKTDAECASGHCFLTAPGSSYPGSCLMPQQ